MATSILTTLLAGKTVREGERKKIIYPYSGSSTHFLKYSRNISIDQFAGIDDLTAFRSELLASASALRLRLDAEKNKILTIAAHETGSPIFYHHEDLEASQVFLNKLSYLKKFLPENYISEPKGNVLLILSANEPVIVTTILVFSALFVGNTVFVKPSAKTPSYGYFLIKELAKIPSLKKRAHYLLTDIEETGRLIKSNFFDFVISFGSRATSKELGILCANSEVEFLQESEGNDWAYVDKKCESLGEVSKIIVESFVRHNGQMCNSVRGVIAHSSVYDEFVKHLKKRISALPVGSPDSMNSRIGALISGTSPRAKTLVGEATATAGEVWNFSLTNNVISPTLILNPDIRSSIISESIFAPVLWIKKAENHSEAISFYQKKNKHGLSFSVFSLDEQVINDFIRRIRAGRININKHPLRGGLWDPLGGIRLSGYGGPRYWVEKLSNRKYVNQKHT